MNNQMNNAVRKIHNLHSSGAVTVTGLSQPRILKQKVGSGIVTSSNTHNQQQSHVNSTNRCYVCDDALSASQQQNLLTETQTSHTATKFPNKIGQLVGDAFMVIVSVDDVVCARCTNLLNYLDRLENDVERVRTNLMNLLHKKYGLNDDSGGGGASPPIKMQKLNSGGVTRTAEETSNELGRVRKVLHTASGDSNIGKQSPPVVSAVQQMKISTQSTTQNTSVGGTQTIQRKTTRIYKCISCDYKTSDMRLFNTHYETCKSQNFQCKNCKKIFPNFGTMKQHMVREHNTTMDNTCAVCHINFVNEPALRKHMEANHSTNVVVTSTTTIPATQQASGESTGATTPLYTCNHCQFKSTDKALFDEHFRKHLSGVKPKPFKCRLCAQRFETRDAATQHARQHQPNYFKCGTCSMSFPKRELLVKHFEVHQQPQPQQTTNTAVVQHQQIVTQSAPVVKQITTTKQQQATSQNLLTTQKLLQETIDEALSDNTVNTVVSSGNTDVCNTAANNIRFFSCHICSLTFIQENYYNQHMEAHSQDKEGIGSAGTGGTTITTSASAISSGNNMLHPSAAALLNDDNKGDSGEVGDMSSHQGVSSGVEADIESIFEKMHSDKNDNGGDSVTSANAGAAANTTSAGGQSSNDNLVITSQQGSGGITFNITIPQPDSGAGQEASESTKSIPTSSAPVSVSIDMPVLDQPDEGMTSTNVDKAEGSGSKEEQESGGSLGVDRKMSGPVSMPSLDDDNDTQEHIQPQVSQDDMPALVTKKGVETAEESARADLEKPKEAEQTAKDGEAGTPATEETNANAHGAADANGEVHSEHGTATGDGEADHNQQQVAMELDEAMQAQVEGGQIKFILNENGQLLQLDNHIITDADGNQILVQDPEQIQQLLQSAGLLQSGDGIDGETLQMMTDGNGQMVLVQGENNETQLIDASLLNADGQLVIQQGHDGELGEGAHVIGEDGTRIPVSVSYTADGQPIVRVQQQMLEAGGGEEDQQHVVLEKDAAGQQEGTSQVAADNTTATTGADAATSGVDASGSGNAAGGEDNVAAAGGSGAGNSGSGGGDFFPLEDLMQQSAESKPAE
ncbi:uncharacterized protein LOC105221078 [Zeugodacus cucurbitae]|uniref:uncharacterized protein LOC105221078 n=1 Tax=Zeugodacus cucurbitae TaxID=28588 RepID=UPI0023D91EB7|nr:uncharacterized protein LOC105221078 [Zeugodacus cucurbitae]XP_011196043.2 uncharacterized protein LOC105221078 [Zeugodacus cucurbitae]XP_011196044.2 uncharacterized protein LOC105221078 [Zeugodacus cucurbitae]XP_011196045.2 uncharacterized protein LOC105221078 [Zeugodacus cucurbitae]XP_028901945.2 uncharacterized protein LOC105221078 [Zeugodacus cucurbitae]